MYHFFLKNKQNCELLKSEKHKNACKTPPKPHGVKGPNPPPLGFSKSIPHPHGGWGWGPHGAPVGYGGGVQTLLRDMFPTFLVCSETLENVSLP